MTTTIEPAASDRTPEPESADPGWPAVRASVIRDALGIGLATGSYALSFGAVSTAAGLQVAQTCALSLLVFTGGSQFALVAVLSGGGGALAAAGTAILLGTRNALYGLRISELLRLSRPRRAAAAHLVIDESAAMAVARADPRAARLAFWATGSAIFILWNLGTLLGALAAHALPDPRTLGLDAAAPAAFLALLAPGIRTRRPQAIALASAAVALISVPLVPAGLPVPIAAVTALALLGLRREPASGAPAEEER